MKYFLGILIIVLKYHTLLSLWFSNLRVMGVLLFCLLFWSAREYVKFLCSFFFIIYVDSYPFYTITIGETRKENAEVF